MLSMLCKVIAAIAGVVVECHWPSRCPSANAASAHDCNWRVTLLGWARPLLTARPLTEPCAVESLAFWHPVPLSWSPRGFCYGLSVSEGPMPGLLSSSTITGWAKLGPTAAVHKTRVEGGPSLPLLSEGFWVLRWQLLDCPLLGNRKELAFVEKGKKKNQQCFHKTQHVTVPV